ncbi:MAG: CPBP family intramembrane metalloprotease [Erysipelotrichaceae bacterium]|nr:CPBP family intramembrane metalloprotease [Erysipelotrichaceae bacterium]
MYNETMKKNERTLAAIMAIAAVILMYVVEKVLRPGYLVKSLLKMAVFGGMMILFSILAGHKLKKLLNLEWKLPSRKLILFMAFAYAVIIAGFLLFRNMIDLTQVKANLIEKEHLTRSNFLWVFAYITVCNSFLEESFFRGFITNALGKGLPAYLFSAFLFAIYHISIMSGWFSPLIMVICILGLMGAGLFMQYVCEKNGTLLASWLVHGCANLAINTIGTIMFLSM